MNNERSQQGALAADKRTDEQIDTDCAIAELEWYCSRKINLTDKPPHCAIETYAAMMDGEIAYLRECLAKERAAK